MVQDVLEAPVVAASPAGVRGGTARDEGFPRFPDRQVDRARAGMSSTATMRGRETLPAFV